MDVTQYIVNIILVNKNPGDTRFYEFVFQRIRVGVNAHCHDLGTGHHTISDLHGGEIECIAEYFHLRIYLSLFRHIIDAFSYKTVEIHSAEHPVACFRRTDTNNSEHSFRDGEKQPGDRIKEYVEDICRKNK